MRISFACNPQNCVPWALHAQISPTRFSQLKAHVLNANPTRAISARSNFTPFLRTVRCLSTSPPVRVSADTYGLLFPCPLMRARPFCPANREFGRPSNSAPLVSKQCRRPLASANRKLAHHAQIRPDLARRESQHTPLCPISRPSVQSCMQARLRQSCLNHSGFLQDSVSHDGKNQS